MKKYINLMSMVLALVFLFSSVGLAKEIKKPVLAPDFQLQDTHQDTIKLSSFRGQQPVILFFWATWCPFCQKELSILNQRYPGLVEDGFEVLAIDVGELPNKVNDFISSYSLAYRVLLDMDTTVAKTYEIIGYPTYAIVNKDGYIVFQDNYFPQGQYKELVSDKDK